MYLDGCGEYVLGRPSRHFDFTRVLVVSYRYRMQLTVTPHRRLLDPPTDMMSNRVTREFGADNFIRVAIRRDNYSRMHADEIARMKVGWFGEMMEPLLKGITVGGRKFEFLGEGSFIRAKFSFTEGSHVCGIGMSLGGIDMYKIVCIRSTAWR